MNEIPHQEMIFYQLDKMNVAQAGILCGSITIPRYVYEADLQRAANEVFRLNDELRVRFVEKDGKVYRDIKPFEEQTFDVMHFESKEALDEWGNMYATIPLKLDVRSEGKGIPKNEWKTGDASPTLIKNVLLHDAKTTVKRIKNRVKVRPTCCEIKLVYLPDSCGAIIKMYHLVSDAWSMLLVANQFLRLLKGETPQAFCYDEFLRNEEAYKESKRFAKDRAFFEEQYKRCPEPTPLWPKTPVTSFEAARSTATLDTDLSRLICEYAEERGTSPYIVFLTAMSVFVSRKLNRDKFYIGSVVINRSGTHDLNTVGCFYTTVPILVEFNDKETFASAIHYLRNESFSCFRHAKGRVENTNDTENMLYDTWVSYQNATLNADSTAECTQYYCKYALDMPVFSIEDRSLNNQFKMHFDHNLKISEAEVDEMFNVILSVLRDGIENDDKRLCEIGK